MSHDEILYLQSLVSNKTKDIHEDRNQLNQFHDLLFPVLTPNFYSRYAVSFIASAFGPLLAAKEIWH